MKKLMVSPGDQFGRLTIMEEAPRGHLNSRRFYCRCSCGNPRPKIIALSDLTRKGGTKSCGCLITIKGSVLPKSSYKERYHNTAKAAEYFTAAFLSQQGYVVHFSSSGAPHDLLAEASDGTLIKVQVKGTMKAASGRRRTNQYGWLVQSRRAGKYTSSQVDVVALVALDRYKIAFLPLSEIKSSTVSLYSRDLPPEFQGKLLAKVKYMEDLSLESALKQSDKLHKETADEPATE